MAAKKQRKPIFFMVKWLGVPVLLLVLAMVVLFGLAQTPWAKRGLATLMSREVGAYSVTVTNLTGLIPFRPRIKTVRVADADGEFLRLDHIQLDWSPLSLGRRTVEVNEIRVGRVELRRTPRHAASKKTEPSDTDLPPLSVLVHDISLPSIKLAKPVLGQDAVFAANGAGHYRSPQDFSAHAQAKQLDNNALAGQIQVSSGHQRVQYTGHVLVPPDRLVERFLPAPLAAPLQCSLRGAGKRGLWHGELALTEGESSVMDAGYNVRMREGEVEM